MFRRVAERRQQKTEQRQQNCIICVFFSLIFDGQTDGRVATRTGTMATKGGAAATKKGAAATKIAGNL